MFFVCILLLWGVSPAVQANSGIPLLVAIEPFLAFSLVPIILVEVCILRTKLKSDWRETIKAVTLSNLVSTLIGIPMIWAIILIIELFLILITAFALPSSFQSPYITLLAPAWIFPMEKWGLQEKIITTWAISYVMVVFYFVSSWIEAKINCRFLEHYNSLLVKQITWKANIYSYGFLLVIGMGYCFSADKLGISSWVNKVFNTSFHFFLSLILPFSS